MRLLHTEPLTAVRARLQKEHEHAYNVSHAHVMLTKTGGDATTTHALSGELYASKSGWILLDVPNALVRGAFDALNEPGVELPRQSNGTINAHISVMRPEDIEQIGGVDKVTERGHHFHYTLGPIQEVEPSGWGDMSKVWFIQVKSKELQDLRKSYGLTPRPKKNEHDFHITIAVRRKKILQNNDVAKAAKVAADMNGWTIQDSPIDGKGLYSTRPFKSGEVVDHHAMTPNPGLHNSYEQSVAARFTNHSDDPNIALVPHNTGVAHIAIKDIPAGAEMFGDYNTVRPLLGDDTSFTYDGQPYNGESSAASSDGTTPETKAAAGLVWPLMRLGGSVVDVEGLKSLVKGPKEPEVPTADPAEQMLEDDSHLDRMRALPTVAPVPRRRKKPAAITLAEQSPAAYLKEGANHAQLSWMPTECTPREERQSPRWFNAPAPTGAATGTTSRTNGPCASGGCRQDGRKVGSAGSPACISTGVLRSDDQQSTKCASAAITAIAAYYEGNGTGPDSDTGSTTKYATGSDVGSAAGDSRDATGSDRGRLTFDEIKQHLDIDQPVVIKEGYFQVAHGYDGDTLFLLGADNESRTTSAVDASTGEKRAWLSYPVHGQPAPPDPGQPRRGVCDPAGELSKTAGRSVDFTLRLLDAGAGRGCGSAGTVHHSADVHPIDTGDGCGEVGCKSAADEDDQPRRGRKSNKLKEIGLPLGGAGLLAALLHKPTSTLVPAQVTRFPGSDSARVIRGPIYPGAPASVFEDTGGAYMVTSPSQHGAPDLGFPMRPWQRTHAIIDGPASLGQALQQQQRPGHALEALDIHGHGTYVNQNLGDGSGMQSINPRTVDSAAAAINAVPHAPNASIYNYGCNTGACAPGRNDWQQQLADRTGMTSHGSLGWTNITHATGLNAGVNAEQAGLSQIAATPAHGPSESDAWNVFRPGQPRTRIETHEHGKETYGHLPATPLHELSYNIGKPSALLGALNPLLADRKTAKRTAILASLLAAPMVGSESMIRAQEASANQDLHGTDALQSHLSGQAKVLPHLALAALPLLSYGGAKLLGRWKDKKQKQ